MKALTGKRFAALLEQHDWSLARVDGNHRVYTKRGEVARISVPIHGQQRLKAGLQQHLMTLASLRTCLVKE